MPDWHGQTPPKHVVRSNCMSIHHETWWIYGSSQHRGIKKVGADQGSSINAADGNISIRYQGRTLNRRNQEVRPHIPYLVFAALLQPDVDGDWLHLKRVCQELRSGTILVFGLVWKVSRSAGWRLTKSIRMDQVPRHLLAA